MSLCDELLHSRRNLDYKIENRRQVLKCTRNWDMETKTGTGPITRLGHIDRSSNVLSCIGH